MACFANIWHWLTFGTIHPSSSFYSSCQTNAPVRDLKTHFRINCHCWCPQGIYVSQAMSDAKQMMLFDHTADFISDVWILAKLKAADSNEQWLRVSLAAKASVDSRHPSMHCITDFLMPSLLWNDDTDASVMQQLCICDETAYTVPVAWMSRSQWGVSRLADAVQDWHNGSSAGLEGLKTPQTAAVEDERKVFDTEDVRHGTDDPQSRAIQRPLAAVACRVSEISSDKWLVPLVLSRCHVCAKP